MEICVTKTRKWQGWIRWLGKLADRQGHTPSSKDPFSPVKVTGSSAATRPPLLCDSPEHKGISCLIHSSSWLTETEPSDNLEALLWANIN